MNNIFSNFCKRHPAIVLGAIISIVLFIALVLFQHYNLDVLKLESRWLLVSGVPILIALFVGGYIKKFKGFGIELEAPEKTPELSPPDVGPEMAATSGSFFKKLVGLFALLIIPFFIMYVITILFSALGWVYFDVVVPNDKLIRPLLLAAMLWIVFVIMLSPGYFLVTGDDGGGIGCGVALFAVFVSPIFTVKIIDYLMGDGFFELAIDSKLLEFAIMSVYGILGLISSFSAVTAFTGND